MSIITITYVDILDWAASYNGTSFHAILCDPPYGWHFMNRQHDDSIALRPETWQALAVHLYPGAFIFAFAGPRTYHRLACAMEDAGLILHSPIVWLQAQGFPKSQRVDTQIDKVAGRVEEREIVRYESRIPTRPITDKWEISKGISRGGPFEKRSGKLRKVEIPATDLAKTWAGHRYGLQALKPCVELIAIAQKPYAGKPIDSIVNTGAGALWIDGGRIACTVGQRPSDNRWGGSGYNENKGHYWQGPGSGAVNIDHPSGRWPGNFALVHIPDHYICQQCGSIYPMQPIIEVCPECGGELEYREGCKRMGVKRVKGKNAIRHNIGVSGGGWKSIGYPSTTEDAGYADPDGLETVDAYACVCGCEECGATWTVEPRVERIRGNERPNCIGKPYTNTTRQIYGKYGIDTHKVRLTDADGKETMAFHQRGPCPECGNQETRWLCPSAALGEQSGERRAAYHNLESAQENAGKKAKATWGTYGTKSGLSFSDKGTAVRFYKQADWEAEEMECLPECPVRRLDEAAEGMRASKSSATGTDFKPESSWFGDNQEPTSRYDDSGASRFYHNADWEAEQSEMACVPECPIARLDEQAGERASGGSSKCHPSNNSLFVGTGGNSQDISDSGPASRFYYNADFAAETAERLAQEDPFRYCPKAAKRERSRGLDDFYWRRDKASPSGFVRVSREEWETLDKRERAQGNIHPTVKPLSLLSWLVRLLSPPPEYAPRRLLVPFSGSGSEICAAVMEGTFEEIIGVELIRDYVDISYSRVAFWQSQPKQLELP